MPKKVRQAKRVSTNVLTPETVCPLATCRISLWSPLVTVGTQFQWAQVCATSLDAALSYLCEAEPRALEPDIINQQAVLSSLPHLPPLNTALPTTPAIHVAASENSPLAIAQSLLPDTPRYLSEPPPTSSFHQTAQPPLDPLSEREMDILRLLAVGYTNQEIADILIVARSTIKWYLKQIYSKLDVHSRTQAIARTRQLGLLP